MGSSGGWPSSAAKMQASSAERLHYALDRYEQDGDASGIDSMILDGTSALPFVTGLPFDGPGGGLPRIPLSLSFNGPNFHFHPHDPANHVKASELLSSLSHARFTDEQLSFDVPSAAPGLEKGYGYRDYRRSAPHADMYDDADHFDNTRPSTRVCVFIAQKSPGHKGACASAHAGPRLGTDAFCHRRPTDLVDFDTRPLHGASNGGGGGEKRFIGAYSPASRRKRIQIFLEKRKNRVWTRKVKYDVRKSFADTRMRVKGRFVKKEDEDLLKELLTCI